MKKYEIALTPTEARVLRLISQGFTEREIAGRLCIGPATVHTHVKSIFRKLHVRNKVGAAVWYVRHEHALDETLGPIADAVRVPLPSSSSLIYWPHDKLS